jgi:RNA polymerase sigma-70 factor (ECF subfamily)
MNNFPTGDQMLAFLYHEVRAVARQQLSHERPEHTLSATALVNELYLRLARSDQRFAEGRQFIPAAACMMRQILVDYARRRKRDKRGGGKTLSLDAIRVEISAGEPMEIDALDQALEELAKIDERQARVVELRFFGGLNANDTAAALGVASKTVSRDWAVAKQWLRAWLTRQTMSPKLDV